jgi:hypothetical protein
MKTQASGEILPGDSICPTRMILISIALRLKR